MHENAHWEWKNTRHELPSCDGDYMIANYYSYSGVAYYDGYGFKFDGHYVEPDLWKTIPEMKKRYGKVDGVD